jgi:hypothetical protein
MTRHLELETILGLATGANMRRAVGQGPILSLAWSLDPRTGKPVARWIAPTPHPSVVTEDGLITCGGEQHRTDGRDAKGPER